MINIGIIYMLADQLWEKVQKGSHTFKYRSIEIAVVQYTDPVNATCNIGITIVAT